MGVPGTSIFFGVVGAVLTIRGLWNPRRALTAKARLAACPGPDGHGTCKNTLQLDVPPNSPVLSVGAGLVVSSGPTWVHVQPENEAVVLYYAGISPSVSDGQHVGRGQPLGTSAGRFEFGVEQIVLPDGADPYLEPVEPASWLAVRGFRVASSLEEDSLWCAQGRTIGVPASAHGGCDLQQPTAGGLTLLPIAVSQLSPAHELIPEQ